MKNPVLGRVPPVPHRNLKSEISDYIADETATLLKIRGAMRALTHDRHFLEAGFEVLLL